MRAWLNTQRSWLVVERLPAYAPELNPTKGLWSSLKAVELANLCGPTLAEVIQEAHRGIDRVRRTRTWPTRSSGMPACRSHDPSTRHPRPFDAATPPRWGGQWHSGAPLPWQTASDGGAVQACLRRLGAEILVPHR